MDKKENKKKEENTKKKIITKNDPSKNVFSIRETIMV